jgi:16S rRNA (guanine966-N2)-methyltransferase
VGVEAWSRNYDPVTCVEAFEPGLTCLKRNATGTSVAIKRSELKQLKGTDFEGQAVIFLDPPYDLAQALWGQMSARMAQWIAPSGVLVFETDRKTMLELQNGWVLAETREYGAARFHFWTPA